jgi:NagD protein
MSHALNAIRHVVLDMDGTIYSGSRLFDCTLPFLERLRNAGIGYTFLTNNTSRSKDDYVLKLRGLGIAASLSDIYTAADATIDYLRRELPQVHRIALLGTPSLSRQFAGEGFVIDWDTPEAVVVGFDTTLQYDRLCRTAWWIAHDLPYLATHPDLICPTDEPTVLVDCGAICAALAAATNGRQPIVLGKPSPAILEGLARKHGLSIQEVAMVGDRLYTDVALAQRAGAMSVLVLSGEATRDDALAHTPGPDLVVQDVGVFGEMLLNARLTEIDKGQP